MCPKIPSINLNTLADDHGSLAPSKTAAPDMDTFHTDLETNSRLNASRSNIHT